MALTWEQKQELTKSGVLKNLVGKSWDDPDVQKAANQYYNPSKSSTKADGFNPVPKSKDGPKGTIYYSNNSYPTSGSVWVNRPDGSQTAASARDLQKLLDKGYTYVGVRTNDSGLYSADGDLIQSKSGGSKKSSGGSKKSSGSSSSGSYDIDNMYDQQRKSLIAQLKASIAKAKQGYTDIIGKAGQTYQPLRNQNEVTKEQQLASMREALANQGNAGGTGRQELLGINTAAGNRKNEIDLQQQNVINDANSAISNLDQEAAFKESEITADTAAQKLQALLAENARVDELNREQERYAQEYADKQKQQEFENQLKQQEREDSLAAQQLEREISSIGAYSNDYMAEIQRRQSTGDTADDALIPYLQAARNEKIAQQRAQADNTSSQAYKNAYNLWLQLGVATQEIADILGIPKGSKTLDKIKADYSTAKPYYSPNTGGSSGGSSEIPWYLQ
jgi:hypothetical protein